MQRQLMLPEVYRILSHRSCIAANSYAGDCLALNFPARNLIGEECIWMLGEARTSEGIHRRTLPALTIPDAQRSTPFPTKGFTHRVRRSHQGYQVFDESEGGELFDGKRLTIEGKTIETFGV